MTRRNAMPVVEYDGQTYSLRSRKLNVPKFDEMDRMKVLIWLSRYTYARGYSKPKPLAGLGGAIKVNGA